MSKSLQFKRLQINNNLYSESVVLLCANRGDWLKKSQEREMSFIRNAVIAVAIAAAVPVAASAQGGPPGGGAPAGGAGQDGGARRGGAAQMQQMLMKDITLTADQQAQIDKIVSASREEMQAMRASLQPGTPPDSATRAKMGDLRKKQNTAIRAVLTADQQKTYDANLAELEKRMQEMRRGN
jgi:Spy/CpxP family protein refolding chaperone